MSDSQEQPIFEQPVTLDVEPTDEPTEEVEPEVEAEPEPPKKG